MTASRPTDTTQHHDALQVLEQKLGYTFVDRMQLLRALTHKSFSSDHNERLEFLGDGLLNLVAADVLYRRFPSVSEGELSRMRSYLVREDCLQRIAQTLGLSDLMRISEGERRSGGATRASLLADGVEALVGAIYLEGGFSAGQHAVRRLIEPVLDASPIDSLGKDAKTRLQEWLQGQRQPLPVYRVVQEGGRVQSMDFVVECAISQPACVTQGTGPSRRTAEQQAAQRALDQLIPPEEKAVS